MTAKQIEKLNKIESVKLWINTLTSLDDYNRKLLKDYNGDELDKMTLKEISMLLNFITATYRYTIKEKIR